MDSSRIIVTADGSHTLRSKQFDVTYHSIFGAIEESNHVFISAGIYHKHLQGLKRIRIFEMGFGSGLNALMSLLEARDLDLHIDYTTIEKYPLTIDEINQLNFSECLQLDQNVEEAFSKMHSCVCDERHQINSNFNFLKFHSDIMNHSLGESQYDIIFFDAFAPNAQSELWEKELHSKIYKSLKENGVLVTYCAKGSFKRMLKEIGYQLDPLDGPARKHEMTRAIKKAI